MRWLKGELIQAMHGMTYIYYLIFMLVLSLLALEIGIVYVLQMRKMEI